MGNRCSTVEDEDIKQLKLIPDDISRDVVLIKNLKKLSDRVDKLEKQKADNIFYRLPTINLCAQSVF